MYILALDISLVNTGGSIFDEKGNVIEIFSVPTSSRDLIQVRLKKIADFFIDLKKRYEFKLVVMEEGFVKFNLVTKQIYRATVNLSRIFLMTKELNNRCRIVIKKVTGSGKADKEQVKKSVLKQWKDIVINNDDESDSLAVGLTYFKQQGIL